MPVDLGLRQHDGVFGPRVSDVPVLIPKRLAAGLALPGTGVSLTPVDQAGTPISGGDGTLDHSGVFFANTQLDADTLVKPTSEGFEEYTFLRSAASPRRLFFRVNMPAGGRLVQQTPGQGAAKVLVNGAQVAAVLAPGAEDATGTQVPVLMRVSGKQVILSLADDPRGYQYPIAVDPTFVEEQVVDAGARRSNWEFHTNNPGAFKWSMKGGPIIETWGAGSSYNPGDFGFWGYQTQGNSDIYQVTAATWAANAGAHLESILELQHGEGAAGVTESKELLSSEAAGTAEYADKITTICPTTVNACLPLTGHEHNAVHFQQSAAKACSGCSFSDSIREGLVYLSQPGHAKTNLNTSSPEFEFEVEQKKQKRINALFGTGRWLSRFQGALGLNAEDAGIGVSQAKLEYESAPGQWEQVIEHNYLEKENLCKGVQCFPTHSEVWTLNSRLPNGEDKIRYSARDAMPGTESTASEGAATVKVDAAAPHDVVMSGLPFSDEIREAPYEITGEATDGDGSTVASSGIKTLSLFVDGKEVGEPGGACAKPKGECTGVAKWTVNGAELGAGNATIVLVATDNANNEARHGELVTVLHSKPVPLGPGSLNLESGNFSVGASDVAMGTGLTASRNYSSRDVTSGESGPLGPLWGLSVATSESLLELGEGSVELTSANGSQSLFLSLGPGLGYQPPAGDANLALTFEEDEKHEKVAYYLSNAADKSKVKFTKIGASPNWVPTVQEGPVTTDTVTYRWQTVEEEGHQITEPIETRAPVPPGVECSWKTKPTEMHAGCRALEFTYYASTTAGEAEEAWGPYKGRLKQVALVAYSPASKAMQEIPVAEYAYDKQGRLRAEWDPRISPALKTTYGYDSHGHLTALQPAGEQPWLMTYGTTGKDAGDGRLLKIDQPPAETKLPGALPPENTAAPQLSGSPVVGIKQGVSSGAWNGNPEARGYQWEDCNAEGVNCSRIPGAINPNYTPTMSDVGHTLAARVTATNGRGSTTATALTPTITGEPIATFTASFGHGAPGHPVPPGSFMGPKSIARGTNGNLWLTEGCLCGNFAQTRVQVFSAGGEYQYEYDLHVLGEGRPRNGIALDASNNSFVTADSGKVEEFTQSGTPIRTFGIGESSEAGGLKAPEGITIGAGGNLFVADTGNNRIDVFTATGAFKAAFGWGVADGQSRPESCTTVCQAGIAGSAAGQFNRPDDLAITPANVLWVTDPSNYTIQAFTESGEYLTTIGGQGSGGGRFQGGPGGISVGPRGTIFAVDGGQNTGAIVQFSETGEFRSEFGRGTFGDANDVYVDGENNAWITEGPNEPKLVKRWTLAPVVEGAPYSNVQPGATVEYEVPLEGAGAPAQLGVNGASGQQESAAWGQHDFPVEGTAVIPADAPQAWPASSYLRATAYYLDQLGRLVNVVQPSNGAYGSLATTEYNELNDVIRTLSPGNRAAALEAGPARSVEVSTLLDTKSSYNGESAQEWEVSEPGTELLSKTGPQHKIKYTAGKEVKESLARDHQEYFYDQGRPSGPAFDSETYNVLTEIADLAQLPNHEEVEVHTTRRGYGGQENLGWKLRTPTSITSDPNGANITQTTVYDSVTGQTVEVRGAAGASGNSPHDAKTVYYSAATNGTYPACGAHPEWAGLACETLAAKQPEGTVAPPLPITVTTYNVFNQPDTLTETFGSAVRVKRNTYDSAGRLEHAEVTATGTTNTPLPVVTDKYSASTGQLVRQEASREGITKAITREYNTLGQLVHYEDGDKGSATYRYFGREGDNALKEMSDSSNGGKTTQTYSYDPTTRAPTELLDSAAGKFTASYDTEGRLASELYPDGLCAKHAYNPNGEAVGLEYVKSTSCAGGGTAVWFSESRVPSVHGETMSRVSTLAKETYSYDPIGRLLQAQEEPTGAGCTIRLYSYDEESNRKAQTLRKPKLNGECNTKGGTVTEHGYDEGNRLTDLEIQYETFGNITTLPKADAEKEAITSTYFVDNAVATQTQGKITETYGLDPEGRLDSTLATESKGKIVKKNYVSHYDSPGAAVAWTSEAGKWTRQIPGIDGTLSAVQNSGEEAVLQIHDLNGNIIGTAALSNESEALLTTYNSTEFGAPNSAGAPPRYAWLGAAGVSTERKTGLFTDGGTSYVPQTGMPLQTEQVEPPGLPGGSGGGNAYSLEEEAWNIHGAERVGAEAPGKEAGREREAAEAACRANEEACVFGEVVDPTGHHLYAQGKVQTLAVELEKMAGWASLGKLLELIPKIGDLFKGLEGYQAALIGFAGRLHLCAKLIGGSGRCWVTVSAWIVKNPIHDLTFPYFVDAEPCFWHGRAFYTDRYKCHDGTIRRHNEGTPE
ncbi:MAG: putative large secreted protein [Solirubrobacterales bacterium]|nr:putative large secreted protein [Solirubrobacterales bacterium]